MPFTISLKASAIQVSIVTSAGQTDLANVPTPIISITDGRRVIRDTPRRMRLPVDFEYITLDRKQTAKMIRADLKKWYPDTKFSVRSEMMSGGYTCVRVTWNGETPHQDEVRAFLEWYEGAVSDDSGDGVDPVVTQIEGRWYRFDVDYLSVNRYDDTPEVIDGQARAIVPKLVDGSGDV